LVAAGLFLLVVAPSLCLGGDAEVRGLLRSTDLYNTDRGAYVLDGRLDTEVDFSVFTLGGAYRGYHLSDKQYNPRGIDAPQPAIKHRYAEMRLANGAGSLGSTVRAGHFFATFDRGLTLRSFEDIDLERDTALDGVMGELEMERGAGEGPAVGVTVSGLTGRAQERVTATRSNEHRASGARVALAREGVVTVAASYLERATERSDKTVALPGGLRRFDDHVIGGEVETWLGPVRLAGDYAYREGDYYVGLRKGDVPGHGLYLSGNFAGPWFTLLGEYKDYKRFQHALVNPPTCVTEHVWTLANRVTHVVNLDDERGFLAQGTLSVFENTPVTGGASEARTAGGGLANWEMFGEVGHPVARLGMGVVGGSWSREYVGGKFTEYMTVMLETETLAEGDVPFELGLGGQRIEEPSGETFENYLGSLTWYAAETVTVSGVAEATSQEGLTRDLWGYGEVSAALSDGLNVALGFGTERGGKKCSGGVCYTEPEFAGVRLRLSKSF
jgi:hypothetical protein